MCIIELVDFNETLLEAKNATEAKSTTTRRSRRRGGKGEVVGNEAGTSADVVAEETPAASATEAEATTLDAPAEEKQTPEA
jgi:large subunit ribosomal protein L17